MSEAAGTLVQAAPTPRSIMLLYDEEQRADHLGQAIYQHGINVILLRLDEVAPSQKHAERVLRTLDPSGVICDIWHGDAASWRQFNIVYGTSAASELPFIILANDLQTVPYEAGQEMAIEVISGDAAPTVLLDMLAQWRTACPRHEVQRPIRVQAAALRGPQTSAGARGPVDVH